VYALVAFTTLLHQQQHQQVQAKKVEQDGGVVFHTEGPGYTGNRTVGLDPDCKFFFP